MHSFTSEYKLPINRRSKINSMSKLPKVGTTIFSVMSKLANDLGAVNLSQGFPDFNIDSKIIDIHTDVIHESFHQYAPMPGNNNLILAIQNLIHSSYNRLLPESEILVTAGATEGLFAAISAFVKIGDEVVILDPCYDSYDPAITLNGGIPVHIALTEDYLPDWQRIKETVNKRTKMIIINNPHNPSGRMWKQDDFQLLVELCNKHPQLIVLSDEVYEFITFEEKHISVHHIPALIDRSIIVSSFGKTFHITGWKIGYLTAPEDFMTEIKKVHQFLVFSVNSPAQETMSRYIKEVDVQQLGQFYIGKRDLFRSLMKDSKFKLLPSEGTYFQVVDYSEISSAPDVEFVKTLVQEYGVAAIPISVFNEDGSDQKHIRFCFAKKEETLIKACEKLCKI